MGFNLQQFDKDYGTTSTTTQLDMSGGLAPYTQPSFWQQHELAIVLTVSVVSILLLLAIIVFILRGVQRLKSSQSS